MRHDFQADQTHEALTVLVLDDDLLDRVAPSKAWSLACHVCRDVAVQDRPQVAEALRDMDYSMTV